MKYLNYTWNQIFIVDLSHTNELYMNTSRESSGVWQTYKAHGNWRISLPQTGQWVLVIHIERKYLEETVNFDCLLAAAFQERENKSAFILRFPKEIRREAIFLGGVHQFGTLGKTVPSVLFRSFFCYLLLPEILCNTLWPVIVNWWSWRE